MLYEVITKFNNAAALKGFMEMRLSDDPAVKNGRKTTVYVLQHIHCETPGIISESLKTA